MLTMAEKGGTPPFLADIICEQPLGHIQDQVSYIEDKSILNYEKSSHNQNKYSHLASLDQSDIINLKL